MHMVGSITYCILSITRCQNKINSMPDQNQLDARTKSICRQHNIALSWLIASRSWLIAQTPTVASRSWLIASRSHTPPHDATPITLSSGRSVGGLSAAINRAPLEIAASFVRHTTLRVILPLWTRTPLLTGGGVGIWMMAVA